MRKPSKLVVAGLVASALALTAGCSSSSKSSPTTTTRKEAGFQIESLPVRAPFAGQGAYLFGQAPGIVEATVPPGVSVSPAVFGNW